MKTIISLLLVLALVSCKKANTSSTDNSNNNNTSNNTSNNSNNNVNDTCWINYENIDAVGVEIDKNDTKWLVAVGGLYSFDSKWNYFACSNYFFDNLVINPINLEKTMFLQYSGGFTTFDGKVYKFKDDKLAVFSADYDDLGNLWVSNNNIKTYPIKNYILKINYSTNKIDTVYEGLAGNLKYHNNQLWIAGSYNGLIKYDISQNKVIEAFNQSNSMIGSNQIVDMVFDNLGNLWVATEEGGISKYDGKIWENFNSVNSGLIHNLTTSIAVDKYNNIWVGTIMGLSKYNNSNWTNYTPLNSKILDSEILDIAVDKQDNKWIVTKKGVSRLSKTK
jgi:hypothetical protein